MRILGILVVIGLFLGGIAYPAERETRQLSPTQGASQSNQPRVTIFGGFSYQKDDSDLADLDWLGFDVAASFHLNPWFALTADFSRVKETPLLFPSVKATHWQFTVGPEVAPADRRLRAYARALVGVGQIDVDARQFVDLDTTDFATTVGGGLDVTLIDGFGIRAFQVDWLRLWGEVNVNFIRFSFGVFGRF